MEEKDKQEENNSKANNTQEKNEQKNNQNMNNNNQNTIKEEGFFKKVWNSITKIEEYPNMSAQGLGKAISYLAKIVSLISIVFCLGMIYQTHNLINEGVQYIQNEFPEFSYKDGILNVESETPIEVTDSPIADKIIIDTKTEKQEKINQYMNQIGEAGNGIAILKNQILIKNSAVAGTISYSYKDTLNSFQVTEFTKQDFINYVNSSKMITLYISIFITMFIYAFIIYFLTTLSNVIFLSFFGFITTFLARIKMRYVAIFNMSVYALTLSVILNILYIGINIFIPFNIEYFQVMYIAVAAIYLVAAILILKTDFMNKQMELMKIAEAQEIIRKQLEEKEKQEEEKNQKEPKEGNNKENKEEQKKNKSGDDTKQEPEGSNA